MLLLVIDLYLAPYLRIPIYLKFIGGDDSQANWFDLRCTNEGIP